MHLIQVTDVAADDVQIPVVKDHVGVGRVVEGQLAQRLTNALPDSLQLVQAVRSRGLFLVAGC